MARMGTAFWLLLLTTAVGAVPQVAFDGGRVVVSGGAYRLTLVPETHQLTFALRGADEAFHDVPARPEHATWAMFVGGVELPAARERATWAMQETPDGVVIGRQAVLDPASGSVLETHLICTDEGVLLGSRVSGRPPTGAVLWSPPRWALAPESWAGYLFWGPDGRPHEGEIETLDPPPAYAGISPWGDRGDTVAALDPSHPALVIRSRVGGVDLAVVYVDYPTRWRDARMFLQRHTPGSLLLYAAYAPVEQAAEPLWAWLAPLPREDVETTARRVAALATAGKTLAASLTPIAPAVPDDWSRPVPEFPAGLKRPTPVADINDAAVYTVGETTRAEGPLDLAAKVGTDVIVRGWFKWNQAPPVRDWAAIPEAAHARGILFGGGITCSALYDTENGITRDELLDMATRGPDGQLVDAWDQPGCRHGSLSSPAYRDYLFRWCREQIDAGVDYLFMDEHTAALSAREGYDDHSLADFRRYLTEECPETAGWAADDPRWKEKYKVDLADPAICPDRTMASFDYRAYLAANGYLDNPLAPANPLAALWWGFRVIRDDRAWRELTDRIRAYAAERGRTVLISANGIAKYVDLQVLGVWGDWVVRDGRIDLSENQLPRWRRLVESGRRTVGRRVPVVLFHDWGFGDPPFPWLAVPPSQRELWMRVRGAEIYAAGGFFAFPVLGPFGCDAARDGTLPTIQRQTIFYQRHRDLYLHGRYLGRESLAGDEDLSLAAWWCEEPGALAVHVINRATRDGRLEPRPEVAVSLPMDRMPARAVAVSPDWEEERPVACRLENGRLVITLPNLEAYAVVLLRYPTAPELKALADPVRVVPTGRWARGLRNEFEVLPGGEVAHEDELNAFVQGMYHTALRNPPTFLVNALEPGRLRVHVRAVAVAGARIEYRVDGEAVRTVDLPDRDGKNDGNAPEYDETFEFEIPAGRHRLTFDNVGGDWLTLSWYEFAGVFGAP